MSDIEIIPLGEKWKRSLKKALETSTRWTIDNCGDYNLLGTKGKIFIDDNFWYVYVEIQAGTREDLSFMKISQDGDYELIVKLDRLPTKKEAKIVRNKVGLKKKRTLSPEQVKIMTERLFSYRYKPADKQPS